MGIGRRSVLVAAGAVAVTAVAVVGALGLGGGDGSDSGGPDSGRGDRTVRVTRGTLVDETAVDGTLDHGPEVPFETRAEGTITWLPKAGKTVTRGRTLLRVDEKPVVLLYGDLPMYRELAVGRDPDRPLRGLDVKQFESNLAMLGYSGFTVDDTYSQLTADAVKRWQRDLGRPRTGKVGTGDIAYVSGPIRIARTSVRVGAQATGNVLSYTSTTRSVTVEAPAGETGWAERGNRVTVELPDGHTVKGRVAEVGQDASPAQGAEGGDGGGGGGGGGGGDGDAAKNAKVPVLIRIKDQEALRQLNSTPVTVRYVGRKRENVLTVPVAALVALAEGGHGLEIADAGGADGDGKGSRFVAVKTGLFANGKVEVSGSTVREGLKVRIPE
ncbi:peptidoglycan-binding domain-containing protein [Streptomyces sp. NBS 14/10]|uniref:peptidoglycan-binding domain-containing protein n=1 Tax=Streptomyces sp. NBS 14/10 TaxID=1945643 RepID=UPI000B8017DE|nr:peptidoglycan-binding domain-containing protein [Streptomyces sp. NBS 14/10]KAK1179659.1 peptidoglycan-binding domain-containing protein [Streptomyces sp. NBS 14/10]